MQKIILFTLAIITADLVFAQPAAPTTDKIIVPIINDKLVVIPHATVELLRSKDSVLVKAGITDTLGMAVFQQIAAGTYLFRVSSVNYTTQYTAVIQFPLNESNGLFSAIALQPAPASLQGVAVLSKKPFIQQLPGKTIINVDAGIANSGTTALIFKNEKQNNYLKCRNP